MADAFRRAPPGFTVEQWKEFDSRGLLVIEGAFSEHELDSWRQAIQRVQNAVGACADGFFTMRNFVEADAAFAALIDHSAYLGFAYDLYGEMLKLQLRACFIKRQSFEAE